MRYKSSGVAVGGLASSLSLLVMFLAGVVPFATYAFPAAAGIVLISVAVELGYKTAAIAYAAVSLLSLFILPDREAAVMFLAFFGYYPFFRLVIEGKAKAKPLRWALKLALFNLSMLLSYYVLIQILGMAELLDDVGGFGTVMMWGLLGVGNVIFLIYEYALRNITVVYCIWFRKKFLPFLCDKK